MRYFRGVVLFLSWLLIGVASANEGEIRPFVKGSFEQIKQAQTDKAVIVTFWSETCTYCMEELALFGNLLEKHPNIKIVSVTTDSFLEDEIVNQILSSKNLQNIEKWVFADNYVERIYFDIDKSWRGELPLTYFFDQDKKMVKHLGTINKKELTAWFRAQQ